MWGYINECVWCPRRAIVPAAGRVTKRDGSPSEITEPCHASLSNTHTGCYSVGMSSQCSVCVCLTACHQTGHISCLLVPARICHVSQKHWQFSYKSCTHTFCFFLSSTCILWFFSLFHSPTFSPLLFLCCPQSPDLTRRTLTSPHSHRHTVPGSVSCVTCVLLCVLQTDPTSSRSES